MINNMGRGTQKKTVFYYQILLMFYGTISLVLPLLALLHSRLKFEKDVTCYPVLGRVWVRVSS